MKSNENAESFEIDSRLVLRYLEDCILTGLLNIVKLLLDHGAEIYAPSPFQGMTLKLARQYGYAEIQKLLPSRASYTNALNG